MLINSLLQNKPTIHSDVAGEDIIHLGAITMSMPKWVPYTIYTVSKSHVARPDIISRIVYGTDIYGDFICKVNGISNPFEINEGDLLVIPKIDSIKQFLTVDTFNDSTEVQENKPKVKSKNEKRKANEAIIGDTRFKVDKDNRVIIY